MMKSVLPIFTLFMASFTVVTAQADHHGVHHHGPSGGVLVSLEGASRDVELVVRDGQVVTARLLDEEQKPLKSSVEFLTLTFTEPDGEKEDYKIEATDENGERIFQRNSAHVVHHIVRDPIVVSLQENGETYSSKEFLFPHGPHGGELVFLGKDSLIAEFCVDGDVVAIHILNGQKRSTEVKAEEITLTFTEPDGEVEDYQIPMHKNSGKGTTFQQEDDHIVKHIKRDPIIVTLVEQGVSHSSDTFRYQK
jgi:23S rRNA pseudoU1915 N3-methylase RlmH